MSKLPPETLYLEMGSHQVVHINKLFGPVVARLLRLYIDDQGYWVLEQDVSGDEDLEPRFQQVARFDCDPDVT